MSAEFPYLKPVVARYEGDPALGIEGEIRKFERLRTQRIRTSPNKEEDLG
jgi:hypothetical protein